ncbi:phage portal protein [Ligilactobacillus equi]
MSIIINLKSSMDEDEPVETLDVDFLSKLDADTTQENLINRLLDALYQTSMIVNLNDKDFGNASGVALEMKFKPMLNLDTSKARKFTKSLRELYRVLFKTMLINGVDPEAWDDIDVSFHYDLPHNAQTAQTLSGLVSRKTWLKALSIVNDVQAESDAIDKEQQDQLATNMQVIADNRGLTDGIGQGRKEAD